MKSQEGMDKGPHKDVPTRSDILARDDALRALFDSEIAVELSSIDTPQTTAIAEYIASNKQGWEINAACKGLTKYFYGPKHEVKTERDARVAIALAICHSCTVSDQCYDKALENKEKNGIWGGEDTEAHRLVRRRAARQ